MDKNLIGQSLGRYHILEQLGEGGMATVFKAYDTRLERDVAIKVIRVDQFAPAVLERILKRFEREAKSLAKLTHPNIVHVNDYGEQDNIPYLVMDYLPGGTVKKLLGKPMPWRDVVKVLIPVAEALDFAHKQGVVHRDVKPANILLTEAGQPMLTDFGIAKIVDTGDTIELTGTGAFVGTPEYMAPEQATAKTADHRADIYSLGIVLYEMVTGRKPYQADTPFAVMIKQASDPLPRPSQFNPDIPKGVENILIKALAKKPEDRYQSMDEMKKAMEGVVVAEGKSPKVIKEPKAPSQGRKVNWKVLGRVVVILVVMAAVMIGWQSRSIVFPAAILVSTSEPLMVEATDDGNAPQSTNKTTATAAPTSGIGSTLTRVKDGMVMVYVPAGVFNMGSPEDVGANDEHPQHAVFLDEFWIDRTEVTNAMYKLCVNAGNCTKPEGDYYNNSNYANHPVLYINWNQAKAYCAWAGGDLPTEAQWEKAARGTSGMIYPWGDTSPSSNLLNYNGNVGNTIEVGNYPNGASPYGALDMSGNVWEWVNDWYGENYYSLTPSSNPQGPASGDSRVLRGGSWPSNDDSVRAAYRKRDRILAGGYNYFGFRCASSDLSTANETNTPAKVWTYPDMTVGYLQTGSEGSWRVANTDSFKETAAQLGLTLKFYDSQNDLTKQIAGFQQFIQDPEVDVIVMSPLEVIGWDQVLADAQAAGKPVILSDRRIDGNEDKYVTFIGADFVEEGRKAGLAMCELLKDSPSKNVWELQGNVGAGPAIDRGTGFRETAEKCGITVTNTQTANWSITEGKEVTEAWLKQSKDVQGIFGQNDEMAFGAIEALKEAGLVPAQDVKIISVDATSGAFQAMLDGTLNGAIECSPLLAPQVYEAALAALNGETLPKWIPSQESEFYMTDPNLKEVAAGRKY